MRWSQHDENPIYDVVAATEAQTLLRNSSVTFRSLNESFKRQLKCRDATERSPSPVFESSEEQRTKVSPFPLQSNERLTSSGRLNAQRVPGITKLGAVEMTSLHGEVYSDAGQLRESPPPVLPRCQKQLPPSVAKKTPLSVHPKITRIRTPVGDMERREGEELYTSPEEVHRVSNGIDRQRLHSDSFLGSKPRRVKVEVGVDGVNAGAIYTIPEATSIRRRLKSEGDTVEEGVDVIGPQRADLRPPKPPRIRRRENEHPSWKAHRQVHVVEGSDSTKQKARMMKPGEILEVGGAFITRQKFS